MATNKLISSNNARQQQKEMMPASTQTAAAVDAHPTKGPPSFEVGTDGDKTNIHHQHYFNGTQSATAAAFKFEQISMGGEEAQTTTMMHLQQQEMNAQMQFQMPTLFPLGQPQQMQSSNSANNHNNGKDQHQPQAAPHFVVFEFDGGATSFMTATTTIATHWASPEQQQQHQQWQALEFRKNNAIVAGGAAEAATKPSASANAICRTAHAPFRPIGQSTLFLHQRTKPPLMAQQQQNNVEAREATTNDGHQQQICFTMMQIDSGRQQHSNHHHPHRNNGLANVSRLLFDNPMFRRLPNWHFFGDDRRVMPIPRVIPLLPVPVERTLLSIAPSPVWVRQLLLLGILNVEDGNNGICCSFGQAAIDYECGTINGGANEPQQSAFSIAHTEWSEAEREDEEEEEEEIPLPPTCSSTTIANSSPDGTEIPLPDSGGECPCSSGIESMSSSSADSDDTTATAATTPTESCCSCTPVRALSVLSDGEMEEEEQQHELVEKNNENGTNCNTTNNNNGSSSTSNSNASSTPNSPPTFDRRTVRMSRTKRDAVLRLSISSRHYIDDDASADATSVYYCEETPRYYDINENNQQGNTSCSLDFYQISCMDVLSEHIFNFKQNTEQSSTELNRKLILRDQLYYAISPIFPMCGLYIVGSSLNGFGTKHSDLDLCLMITNRDIDQRSDAVVVLSSVFRTLENFSLVVDQQLILAKVPILRIKCSGAFEGIVVDLNVNNSVAIRNTHLMSYYSGFDWRVRPIVMVVKEWAKCRGINNASHSSFTSYSLALMVIHYLQCGANPPVLPSLQKIYPNRFSEKTDVRLLNISQPLEPMPSAVWNFDQRLTLSELLLGFLQYYAYDFNFDHDAISIRTGRKVNRAQVAQNQSPFNTLSQWHCICIEEPFTLSNAAHSIYDQRIFNYIKESFTKSYIELDKHRDLDQFLAKPTGDEELRLVMPLPQEIMIIPNDKVENTPTNHANYCL